MDNNKIINELKSKSLYCIVKFAVRCFQAQYYACQNASDREKQCISLRELIIEKDMRINKLEDKIYELAYELKAAGVRKTEDEYTDL